MLTISVTVNHHHLKSNTKLETLVFLEPQDAPDLFPGHHAQGQLRASSRRRAAAKKKAERCDDFGLPQCKISGLHGSWSATAVYSPCVLKLCRWLLGLVA